MTGDEVAVGWLASALSGAATVGAGLVVELEQLGDVLSDERGCYLELAMGEVGPASVIEDGDVEGFDPDELESDRWLYVPGNGRDAWGMASFTDQVPDALARDDSQVAVDSKGVSDGSRQRWTAMMPIAWTGGSGPGERRTGRAPEWLADESYARIPRFRPSRVRRHGGRGSSSRTGCGGGLQVGSLVEVAVKIASTDSSGSCGSLGVG